MKTEFRFKSLFLVVVVLGLVAAQPVAADENANDDIQKFTNDCMDSLGNEPFCACMANVLKTQVPKEHLSHNAEGEIQFHKDMSDDEHNNATKGAAECQEKFRPEAAESS